MSHATATAAAAALAMANTIAPLDQLDEPASKLELCRQLELRIAVLDREAAVLKALVTGLRIDAEVALATPEELEEVE